MFSEEACLKTEAKSQAQQPHRDSQHQQDRDMRRGGERAQGTPLKTAGARFTARPSPMAPQASLGLTQGFRKAALIRKQPQRPQSICYVQALR